MYLSRVRLKPNIGQNTQLGQLLQQRTYGTHQLLWDLFEQPKRDFLYREEIAKEQLSGQSGARGEPIYYLLSKVEPKQETPLFITQSKAFNPVIGAGTRLAFRLRANPVVTRQGCRHDLVMDEQLGFCRRLCQELGLPATGKKQDLRALLSDRKHEPIVTDWLCSYLSQTQFLMSANQQTPVPELLDLALQHSISQRLASWLTNNASRTGIFSLGEQTLEDDWNDQTFRVPAFQWAAYKAHPLPEKQQHARFMSVELSGELVVQDPERFITLIQQGIGPAKGFGCGLMLVKPVNFA